MDAGLLTLAGYSNGDRRTVYSLCAHFRSMAGYDPSRCHEQEPRAANSVPAGRAPPVFLLNQSPFGTELANDSVERSRRALDAREGSGTLETCDKSHRALACGARSCTRRANG
jgi:hypothetical protein